MRQRLTVASLAETLGDKLALEWRAGRAGGARELRPSDDQDDGCALAGHLNFIHPNQIQVLGAAELAYLDGLGKNSQEDTLAQLFSADTRAVLVAGGESVPDWLSARAEAAQTPLFTSRLPPAELLERLLYYVANLLAQKTVLHGVYMEVLGMGVLVTGASGEGKSELALELLSRGHRLIADDATEFSRIAPDIISGACPPALQDFLEVRGLGILNVRNLFGDNSIKKTKYLRLIVHLESMDEERLRSLDRLYGAWRTREVLGMSVPEITLPVAPGRNLAVLVETAVRNHSLRLKGMDATEDFMQHQQALIEHGPT
jgi:HPr kinase/phosphorylase